MFKAKNKDTKTTSMAIVNFEQENVNQEVEKLFFDKKED